MQNAQDDNTPSTLERNAILSNWARLHLAHFLPCPPFFFNGTSNLKVRTGTPQSILGHQPPQNPVGGKQRGGPKNLTAAAGPENFPNLPGA